MLKLKFDYICVCMPRNKQAVLALQHRLMSDYLSGLFTKNDNCYTYVCDDYIAAFHECSGTLNPAFTVYSLSPAFASDLDKQHPDPKGGK